MRRFLAIVRVTILQLIGRRRSIGLIALGLIPAFILTLFALNEPDRETEEFFRTVILFLVLGVTVPISAIMLGSSSMGDERENKTISFLALRPIRREVIAAAKLVATWISSFVIGGVGAAATAIVLGLSVGSWNEVPAILAGTAITALGFAAVLQVVGYITDRAVVIGLGYLLIWEGIVTSAADQVATTSIWRIGVSAYAGIIAGDHWGAPLGLDAQVVADLEDLLGRVNPGAWGALAKVVGLAVLSVVALTLAMRDRDLVR